MFAASMKAVDEPILEDNHKSTHKSLNARDQNQGL